MKNKQEVKFINYRRYISIIAILSFCVIALNIMYRVNSVFATSYSETIYPHIVRVLGGICSIFPFSVFEILMDAMILAALFSIGRLIMYAIYFGRKKMFFKFTYRLKKTALNAVCIVLTCLLVYSLTCGINCYRLDFAVCNSIDRTAHSKEDLIALTHILIEDANELSDKVTRDENGYFTINHEDAERKAVDAMILLSDTYPCLADSYHLPKPILLSKVMSYSFTTGMYSPFTTEANYNNDVVDLEIPYTICHELVHVSGFMKEDEANFVAYLACMNSDSNEFRYSGTLGVMWSVLGNLYDVRRISEHQK